MINEVIPDGNCTNIGFIVRDTTNQQSGTRVKRLQMQSSLMKNHKFELKLLESNKMSSGNLSHSMRANYAEHGVSEVGV